MGVAKSLIFVTLFYLCSKLLMILFSNKWCLLKVTFFIKTMLVKIYSKILHHIFIPTIYKNFNKFLYLSRVNENFKTFKCTLSQKCKRSCLMKTATCSHTVFTWLSPATEQLFGKFHFAFETKKLFLVGKIIWRFDMMLLIWLIFFIGYW